MLQRTNNIRINYPVALLTKVLIHNIVCEVFKVLNICKTMCLYSQANYWYMKILEVCLNA